MATELTPIITHITLDLAAANNFDFVKAVQGDNETRYIYITLLNDCFPYSLDCESIVLRGTKPDGTGVFNYCTISENGEVIVELTEQILAVAGIGNYEIALYGQAEVNDETDALTTFPFRIVVDKANIDAEVITSTNEFKAITEIMGNAETLRNSLETIQEARESALESKEDAALSAASAKTSETNAANSAASATDKAEEALRNAEAAGSKATEASNYAAKAETHAAEAESWAHGSTGTRTGEDTDNSKYWSEQSKEYADIWKDSDHTYSGITVTSEKDLNNITTPGIYKIDNTGKTYTNTPGITRFVMHVATHERYIVQMAHGIYASTSGSFGNPNPIIYLRAKDTLLGIWSEWKLPDAKNAATVNGHTVEADIPSDAEFTDTVYTHPDSGVTAGTYRSVTVDTMGHVTDGSNPTVAIEQGGTGAVTADAARTNLDVPPTSHASTADTYGKGTGSSYGHLKISDNYTITANTSYNASAGVAASLYTVQKVYSSLASLISRVEAMEEETATYTLAGKIFFDLMSATATIPSCLSFNSIADSLFTDTTSNSLSSFKPKSNGSYYYKFSREGGENKNTMPYIKYGSVQPNSSTYSAGSTLASVTSTAENIVNEASQLDEIGYNGPINFSTAYYYYGYCAVDNTCSETRSRKFALYLYEKS